MAALRGPRGLSLGFSLAGLPLAVCRGFGPCWLPNSVLDEFTEARLISCLGTNKRFALVYLNSACQLLRQITWEFRMIPHTISVYLVLRV